MILIYWFSIVLRRGSFKVSEKQMGHRDGQNKLGGKAMVDGLSMDWLPADRLTFGLRSWMDGWMDGCKARP